MLERVQQFEFDVAQCGDALELLQSLPDCSAAVVVFDPQHRSNLDALKYGNEGARQIERCRLPQMTDEYIDLCSGEIARVLRPSGYLFLWSDVYRLCEGYHLRHKKTLPGVDLIAWDDMNPKGGRRFSAHFAEAPKTRAVDLERPQDPGQVGRAGRPHPARTHQARQAFNAAHRCDHSAGGSGV
jgi:hypothetical protein